MKIRKSSRAIVLNKDNQIFLFQYHFDYLAESKSIWITPGGSLEEGESFEDALKRELFEELGVLWDKDCVEIYYRNPLYTLITGEVVQSSENSFSFAWRKNSFHMLIGRIAKNNECCAEDGGLLMKYANRRMSFLPTILFGF